MAVRETNTEHQMAMKRDQETDRHSVSVVTTQRVEYFVFGSLKNENTDITDIKLAFISEDILSISTI
eukprot:jgi/Psemu1/59395/gm1.59395_g